MAYIELTDDEIDRIENEETLVIGTDDGPVAIGYYPGDYPTIEKGCSVREGSVERLRGGEMLVYNSHRPTTVLRRANSHRPTAVLRRAGADDDRTDFGEDISFATKTVEREFVRVAGESFEVTRVLDLLDAVDSGAADTYEWHPELVKHLEDVGVISVEHETATVGDEARFRELHERVRDRWYADSE